MAVRCLFPKDGLPGEMPTAHGAVDTGAVNGMVGITRFLDYDANRLKPHGLGPARVEGPQLCGGIT